jgi:hypothetical protein
MSKITYIFDTPVPSYFRSNGYFKCPKNRAFVTWAFSICSTEPKIITVNSKQILLDPFQFVSGRDSSTDHTGLTVRQTQTQIDRWIKLGLLRRVQEKCTIRYSVFEWMIHKFPQIKVHPQNIPTTTSDKNQNQNAQQNAQQITHGETTQNAQQNAHQKGYETLSKFTSEKDEKRSANTKKNAQRNAHNLESKKLSKDTCRKENPLHPYPSSPYPPDAHPSEEEDSSFEIEIKTKQGLELIKLSQGEYEDCLAIKGSHEEIVRAMTYIWDSPKRNYPVKNWPNTLKTWKVPDVFVDPEEKNRKLGDFLVRKYGERRGFRCEKSFDAIKNQDGIDFFHEGALSRDGNRFIAFKDEDFEGKCLRIIEERGMRNAEC